MRNLRKVQIQETKVRCIFESKSIRNIQNNEFTAHCVVLRWLCQIDTRSSVHDLQFWIVRMEGAQNGHKQLNQGYLELTYTHVHVYMYTIYERTYGDLDILELNKHAWWYFSYFLFIKGRLSYLLLQNNLIQLRTRCGANTVTKEEACSIRNSSRKVKKMYSLVKHLA